MVKLIFGLKIIIEKIHINLGFFSKIFNIILYKKSHIRD